MYFLSKKTVKFVINDMKHIVRKKKVIPLKIVFTLLV